jgi:hypothetical protein
MLVKVVLLFLLAMALMAMVANLLFPGRLKKRFLPGRCAKCGRPKIGTGPCSCETRRIK